MESILNQDDPKAKRKRINMNDPQSEEDINEAERHGWHPLLVYPGTKTVLLEKKSDIRERGRRVKEKLKEQRQRRENPTNKKYYH